MMGPEGSRKCAKGAKGAHYFLCTLLPCSRTLRENVLTRRQRWDYSGLVAKKEATGFGDLKLTMADDRQQAAFFRPSTILSSMSGDGGDTLGYAGFRCHRFANPAIRRSPRLATGCAVHKTDNGGHHA
jgi:hypothetical protein